MLKKYYTILDLLVKDCSNISLSRKLFDTYFKYKKVRKIKNNFSYSSDTNSNFLTVEKIEKKIKY